MEAYLDNSATTMAYPEVGTIFQYANCYDQEPFVSEYGKTRGYA